MASRVLNASKSLLLSSDAFENGDAIPREFTCQGDDVSPAFEFGRVPRDARALAFVMDDPEAPGGTFTHWTWWNLAPTTTRLARGAAIASLGGIEGATDFGGPGYGGPCPPAGTHRYYFRLFALDAKLDLARGARPDDVWRALEGRVLAWGETMGTYAQE